MHTRGNLHTYILTLQTQTTGQALQKRNDNTPKPFFEGQLEEFLEPSIYFCTDTLRRIRKPVPFDQKCTLFQLKPQ